MEDQGPEVGQADDHGYANAPAELPRRSLGKVDPSFYIIGVGASAGGLDAIKQLVAQASDGFQHTFVIIQHISPNHKSLMSEILARETMLPVHEVSDDMAVEPGRIYLIPPMSNVVIQGTNEDTHKSASDAETSGIGLRFSLVAPSPRPQLNLPIDLFFQSLAEAVGNRAIAIVLSGTGTDGSRGLRAVKDREGFVIVQEPETADFDGMPQAAIATKIVDLIAPPDAMISEIQRYIALREDGILNVDQLFRNLDGEFSRLIADVTDVSGIDFSQYKVPTLKRRTARRMALNRCEDLPSYMKYVDRHPNELSVLHREFLVGVTNFFRDLPAWLALNARLNRIFEGGDTDKPVKVWSIGCSTGEEAYSAAILLEMYRREHNITREFRVFASDVNEESIRSAKEGIYPVSVLEEIPPEFRTPEFVSFQGDTFLIGKSIRSRVIFNKHNVLEDPPYINTDLIICRNLLIYFSPEMQKKVLSLFSFSMRKDGLLFLGAAETVPEPFSQFESETQQARIYINSRSRVRTRSSGALASAPFFPLPRSRRLSTRSHQRTGTGADGVLRGILENIDACVIIIDENALVLETYGDYRRFVKLPDQAFSANLLDLVDNRLKSAISLLTRKAEKEGHSQSLATKCPVEGGVELVDIFCTRLDLDTHPFAFALLLRLSEKIAIDAGPKAHTGHGGEADPGLIAKLESEIEGLQEMLSVTTEDLSVSNEELQTANEELTVSNEELQASNEEMQSINEELHTVNAENADKILELEEASADIENLLNTSELAVLFLDNDLTIRRFNDTFTRYVNLKPEDYGRPLSTFNSRFVPEAHAKFLEDVIRVHRSGEEIRRELALVDGSAAQMRLGPFKVAGGDMDGIAISIIDVTEAKALQKEIQIQRDRLEGVLESEAAGYWDWDIPSNTEYLSPRFKAMFGYADHEMENTPEAWKKIIHPDDLPRVLDVFDAHVKSRGKVPYDNEVRYFHKDGSIVWVLCRGRVVQWNPDGSPRRMIGVHFDITRLKTREERVYREAEEIRRFAFIAAHDLLQPINTIERSLNAFIEDIGQDFSADQSELLTYLDNATTRMRERIRGVLDYARFFDDTIEFETVDLGKVVAACVEDLGSQIDGIGAKISITPLPQATAKPDLLAQVFENVLSNAMKYRHPDRACEISVSEATAPEGHVAIRFSDNGIGIAPEFREQVFKLFSRLHTDTEYEGLGVGLALCERLIKLHKGSIWVEDGQDGGTSIVCQLRAADESDDDKPAGDR